MCDIPQQVENKDDYNFRLDARIDTIDKDDVDSDKGADVRVKYTNDKGNDDGDNIGGGEG